MSQHDSDSAPSVWSPSQLDYGEPEFKTFEAWKSGFDATIHDVKSFGTFAHIETIEEFVNPGLTVDDTPIPLPLVPRDAEHIRSQCRQAPFDRRDETVVNTKVRDTWELGNERFKLVNPAWPQYLKKRLKLVAEKLGTAPLRADPHKLVLCDPGSFFKPHKDSETEKSPGKIATLVVCLPSGHEGGSIHLEHSDETKVFNTDGSSAYGLSMLSWFSDVTHEIKEVTSGDRLMLTYNLTIKNSMSSHQAHISSAQSMVNQQVRLKALINIVWPRDFSNDAYSLMLPLEHRYSNDCLSVQNLKGFDRERAHSLIDACRHSSCYLLLGNMTYLEDELKLDFLVTFEGDRVDVPFAIQIHELLGLDKFYQQRPDIETRYHNSAAILIPRRRLPALLKEFSWQNHWLRTHHAVVRLLWRDLYDNGDNPTAFKHMRSSLKAVIHGELEWGSSRLFGDFGKILAKMLIVCREHGHSRLTRIVLRLIALLLRHKKPTDELSAQLAAHLHTIPEYTQEQWDTHVAPLICRTPGTAKRNVFELLEKLIDSDAQRESFRLWRPSRERSLLLEKSKLEQSDHKSVVLVLLQAVDLSQEPLVPYLREHANRGLFITVLLDLAQTPVEPRSVKALAIQQLLGTGLEKVCLSNDDLIPDYTHHLSESRRKYLDALPLILVSTADENGLSPESEQVIRKSSQVLTEDCPTGVANLKPYVRHDSFDWRQTEHVVEFVVQLAEQVGSQKRQLPPAQLDAVRALLCIILKHYVLCHMPQRPSNPQDWAYKQKLRGLVRVCPKYTQDINAWQTELEECVTFMETLRTEEVKLLLGDELYSELILLRTLRNGGPHPHEPKPVVESAPKATEDSNTQAPRTSQDAAKATTVPVEGGAAARKRGAEDELGNEAKRQQMDGDKDPSI